jgi:hypothetical protein
MSRHRQRRPDLCNIGREVPSYRCRVAAVAGRTSASDFICSEIGDKIFQAVTGSPSGGEVGYLRSRSPARDIVIGGD